MTNETTPSKTRLSLPAHYVRIDVRVVSPSTSGRNGEPQTPVQREELHQQLDAMLDHVRRDGGIATDLIDIGFAE